MSGNDLWTEKYRPKKIEDLIGNKKKLKIIDKWINDFKNKVDGHKKVLLISGDPGIGKTSTAHIILKNYGYKIIEHNASDIRGKKTMNKIVKKSITYTNILDLMNGGRSPIAIILDEIDNLANGGSEKGGLSAFLDIIKADVDLKKHSKNIKEKIIIYNPIICIYNDFNDKTLNELKKLSVHVEFDYPTKKDIYSLLNKILKKENMKMEENAKNELINYCNYDIRLLINTLQFMDKKKELGKFNLESVRNILDILGGKEKSFILKDDIDKLLTKKLSLDKGMYISTNDRFTIPLYLYEHVSYFINFKELKDHEKVQNYYDILTSLANNDVIQTHIFLNHHWELYNYSGVYGCANVNIELHKNKFNKKFYKDSKKDYNSPYILTKISQRGSNKKKILNIINQLNHVKIDFTIDIIKFLTEFIHYHIFGDCSSVESLVKYMKLKNMQFKDLELILKLRKFNTIKIIKSRKIPKKIEKKIIILLKNS